VDAQPSEPCLQLEPCAVADFPLLRLLNAPEMTEHLGGPESEEKLHARQSKYVAGGPAGSGGMFRVNPAAGQKSGRQHRILGS
jgi:hypothetical protein